MYDRAIQRINFSTFVTALTTIVTGVVIGTLGVWGVIGSHGGLLWRLLATDVIVFVGAVLTNLAIACFRKPGGAMA